eukprot:9850122-Alexandrium_andersonii.AAC.1
MERRPRPNVHVDDGRGGRQPTCHCRCRRPLHGVEQGGEAWERAEEAREQRLRLARRPPMR